MYRDLRGHGEGYLLQMVLSTERNRVNSQIRRAAEIFGDRLTLFMPKSDIPVVDLILF